MNELKGIKGRIKGNINEPFVVVAGSENEGRFAKGSGVLGGSANGSGRIECRGVSYFVVYVAID